ncbi:hypothetical protein HCY60_04565 [Limosilactobacillus fermentum]
MANITSNGGGTNLLIGTSEDEVSGKSYSFADYQISGGLQPGTTYTLSGLARVDQTAMDNHQYVFVFAYTNDWSWGARLAFDGSLTAKYNTTTFTTPSGKQLHPYVDVYLMGGGSNNSGTGYISKLKLEKGTVAHDWSPAPEDAQNQFTQVKQTIDGVTTTVSNIQGDVSQLKVSASSASVALSDAAGNISNLQATAKSFSAALSDTNSNVASVTATASELETKYADAAGDISTLQANAKGMTQTISDAQGDIAKLKTRADGFDTEFATANGNISKLQTDATGITQTLTNAKSDIAVLQSRADGFDAKYATAAGDINTLKTNASGFSQTLTNAQGDISTLKSTVSGVQNTLTDAQGNISTLQSDVSGLKKTTSDNVGNIATLQASAKTLTSQMSGAQGDISTLKQTASGISSQVTALSDKAMQNRGTVDSPDFNSLTQAGYYTITSPSNGKNYPIGNWGTLEVSGQVTDNNGRLNQKYVADNNGPIYTRQYNNLTKSWTAWFKVANQNDIDTLNGKITANTTQITQNKQAIALKADQTTVDNTNGTVQKLQSQLQVQAGQIATKVSSSDLDAKGYATQEYTQTQIKQTSDSWNANLTSLKTDVNAIKTNGGGQNLVANTGTDITIDATSSTASNWSFATLYFTEQPKQGDLITVSADSILTGTGTLDEYQVILYDSATSKSRSNSQYLKAGKRDSVTLSLDNLNGNGDTVLLIYAGKAGETQGKKNVIHHLMVEKGMVAHDWSPAPSDIATVTSVTNLSIGVEGVQAQVYNSDGSSKIDQLSNMIATKVSQGDYNSQITQLKNDINLRVTKGDLISQINLQAGTALIQSNKLVLDAGTTVITGEAFIPSAAISNIQADKIQIGNSQLFSDDGTLNLINQNAGTASIKLTTGNVQGSTQPVTEFANGYNLSAIDISPVGTVVRPTLFFEDYPGQAKDTGYLGFSRHQTSELYFHTYDDTKELFRIACVARFNQELHVDKPIWQQGLSIASGNTIWSGSDYLAVGDHISNTYTNIMARCFSSQSTLSSKTNIEEVDPKDALDLVNQTDIRSYQYKSDVAQGKAKRYTSLIIDDVNDVSQYHAPNEFVNEERTGRDDGSAVGYLFLAVKELTRRIKTLEEKLNG